MSTNSMCSTLKTVILSALCLSILAPIHLALSSSRAEARETIETRTTTKRVSKKTRRRSSHRALRRRSSENFLASARSSRYRAGRSYRRSYRRRSYRRSYGRRAVVSHRPSRRGGSVTSSRAGTMRQTFIEVGGSLFSPLQGEVVSGLQLAFGTRLGPIAGVVETQLAQSELGAQLHDLNAQFRVYLPLGENAEIYPLVAFGQSDLLTDRSASHVDLGIGAQLNISRHFAVGARYSARIVAEEVNGVPTNGHNLLAQAALRF